MIDDKTIAGAVSKILVRSERQPETEKLIDTFVDVGILPQLNNRNHQVFYGRRGTGKTHVLKVLESELSREKRNVTVYVDSRVLGSTAQFSDPTRPIGQRCLALFRDILAPVRDALLERVVYTEGDAGEKAFEELDALTKSFSEASVTLHPTGGRVESSSSRSGAASLGAKAHRSSVGLTAELTRASESTDRQELEYRVEAEDKVIFPDLHGALSRTLELTDSVLYLLLDEWSSLPEDLQPYLSEFLKRGLLPVTRAVVKISALEYRSVFEVRERKLGFEVGADVSASLHLDDYYVYDKNPTAVADAFADMIYRHMSIGLPDGYLKSKKAKDGRELQSRMFTERRTFRELARASEGVARDLIHIFTLAFFEAQRRGRNSIDRDAVTSAARQWFEQDKSRDLTPQMGAVLGGIVNEVIGAKKARSFLLPKELQSHALIQALFDARVLHIMQKGYADKDNPGRRYDIYTLDYGTYVDLLGTSKQPELNFGDATDEPDSVVPFDDKRSIRRIILTKEFLSDFES